MPLVQPKNLNPRQLFVVAEGGGRLGVRLQDDDEMILSVTEDDRSKEWHYRLELNSHGRDLPFTLVELVEEMRREMTDALFSRGGHDLYPALDHLDGKIRVEDLAIGYKPIFILDAPWDTMEGDPVTRHAPEVATMFWSED
jgi:hypothetical protein